MRLYPIDPVTAVDDLQHGHFEPVEDGGFDFPDSLGAELHSFHLNGRPTWETFSERQERLIAAELERLEDPATLQALAEEVTQPPVSADPAGSASLAREQAAEPQGPAGPGAGEPPVLAGQGDALAAEGALGAAAV